MAGKKRKCFICGKEYSYCPVCDQDKNKPTYLFLFCSDKCNQINDVISKYEFGKLNIKDANEILKKIDINGINIISKSNKKIIEEIMNYTYEEEIQKKKKNKRNAIETNNIELENNSTNYLNNLEIPNNEKE